MWAKYKNGNSIVKINLENGTKIRETAADEFDLDFPESIDVNCTTVCSAGCPFCYANCTPNGKHANLIDVPFIDTLQPYTEIALQVNDMTHPDLFDFLKRLKAKRVIANITINQAHLDQLYVKIRKYQEWGLIKGVGISLRKPTPEFIEKVKTIPNAVIHVINGILSASDIEALSDNNLKILILGYKKLGRGVIFETENDIQINARQRYLYDVLDTLPNHFKVVSFDNLAIEQLDVKRILKPGEWEEFYMGDEGTSSMFIDLVTQKFGVSSLCSPEEMHPITKDIKEMFKTVKEEAA